MPRVSVSSGLQLLLTMLIGCGGESAPTPPQRPSEPPAAAPPMRADPPARADPVAPAAPSTPPPSSDPAAPVDPLALVVDPEGRSAVVLRETRGARTFALVLRDEVALGMRAVLDAESDAVLDAYESAVIECPDVRCMAALARNVGMLADTVVGRGWSWHLAIVEGGRVVTRRSLVALTVHDPAAASDASPPRMQVADVDGDTRLEVLVEVPLRPIRDDSMMTDRYDEVGSLAFVLDERVLDVQVRWTSEVSVTGGGEEVGDSYEEVWTESCTRTEEPAPGALVIVEGCGQRAERRVRCPYDAARDVYACPARFAEELLRPLPRHEPQHYVGQDEQELVRALGGPIGSRFGEIRARARATADEEQADPITPPPPTPHATITPTTSAPAPCPLVVDDPAPPLHVRAEPSARSAVVGDAPNGTRVTYLEQRGRWARIDTPVAGWIWTENVRARCD